METTTTESTTEAGTVECLICGGSGRVAAPDRERDQAIAARYEARMAKAAAGG